MFRPIKKRVRHWQQAGLISDQQSHDILFYENNQRVFSQMLLQVAVAFVVLGFIAIVGSNWIGISVKFKLFSILFSCVLLAGSANFAYKRVYIKQFEASMLLLYIASFSFLLSLGFWFQLTLEPYQILLFWTLATLPSTFLVRWPLTLFAWVVISTVGLYGFLMNAVSHDHVLQLNVIFSFPFFLGIFAAVGPRHLRNYFSWEAVLSFATIVTALSFNNTLQLDETVWLTSPLIVSILFLLALKKIKHISLEETISWSILLALYNLVILINYVFLQAHGMLATFLVVFLAILCLSMAAFIAHIKGSTFISRALLLVCLVRAITWYFEALGGLLFTGIGLIITGATLFIATWLIRKSYKWINPSYCH